MLEDGDADGIICGTTTSGSIIVTSGKADSDAAALEVLEDGDADGIICGTTTFGSIIVTSGKALFFRYQQI